MTSNNQATNNVTGRLVQAGIIDAIPISNAAPSLEAGAILPAALAHSAVELDFLQTVLRSHEHSLFGQSGVAAKAWQAVRHHSMVRTRPDGQEVVELENALQVLRAFGADPASLIEILTGVKVRPQLRSRDGVIREQRLYLQGQGRAGRAARLHASPPVTAHPAEVPTPATELKAGDTAEFLALLRMLQARSGASRAELVRRSGIPSSSLYSLLEPKREALPQQSDQVRKFLEACGLDTHAVTQVMRVWADLYDRERKGNETPPGLAEEDKASAAGQPVDPDGAGRAQVFQFVVASPRTTATLWQGMVTGSLLVASVVMIAHLATGTPLGFMVYVAIGLAFLLVLVMGIPVLLNPVKVSVGHGKQTYEVVGEPHGDSPTPGPRSADQ
ncbi:helix-turn-helix domain-containing protein [Crossiella sp. SN42]|uniref:helix-turn-helix domain-containing protein n=1 Tax=Crossiella sp. SN42 TaxID=2944808 RepID=UPI00207C434E|nr:helix-turn-helix transcriptional regulator [Crossiella sp. SN42]MCO1575845.1 helix-turn-helix domain-containing protein [Crossiella sp. SN42]